jgi:hypothetical protein
VVYDSLASPLVIVAIRHGAQDVARVLRLELPCTIKLLPNPKKTMGFHDFEECERLLTAAEKRSPQAYLMVLLGGDDRSATCT